MRAVCAPGTSRRLRARTGVLSQMRTLTLRSARSSASALRNTPNSSGQSGSGCPGHKRARSAKFQPRSRTECRAFSSAFLAARKYASPSMRQAARLAVSMRQQLWPGCVRNCSRADHVVDLHLGWGSHIHHDQLVPFGNAEQGSKREPRSLAPAQTVGSMPPIRVAGLLFRAARNRLATCPARRVGPADQADTVAAHVRAAARHRGSC